ncbi:KptA family-domain-containing protein [Pavlovales sp. CCMP2436]|nr:KptA family-domain-containing protein [Pavlovales sp. CCMP2436]
MTRGRVPIAGKVRTKGGMPFDYCLARTTPYQRSALAQVARSRRGVAAREHDDPESCADRGEDSHHGCPSRSDHQIGHGSLARTATRAFYASAGCSPKTSRSNFLPPTTIGTCIRLKIWRQIGRAAGRDQAQMGRRDETPEVKLSKKLSCVLRHGVHENGLGGMLRPDGFVPLRALLALPGFRGPGTTVAQVQALVADNKKQRFALCADEATGELLIRANQGHTFLDGLDDEALLEHLPPPPELCTQDSQSTHTQHTSPPINNARAYLSRVPGTEQH